MVFLLILAFFTLIIIASAPKSSIKSGPCNDGHSWIYRNEGTDEEYMVCDKCKYLPGLEHQEERKR